MELNALLTPSTIAVIGVSPDPEKVGHKIFVNLSNFPGTVFPVHPSVKTILGKTVYKDILSIPSPVDLAVIATPGNTVESIVMQCVDKKVKAVIVIAAGFAEDSSAGKKTQERIAKLLKENNIILLGPNTLGCVNPHAKMNASFAKSNIEKGSIALISQSGALLTTLFDTLASREVGCSFAVSLGNGAGTSVNDALRFAAGDPNTKIIALYCESLTDIPDFFQLCKTISRSKPILLLKGGMSDEGQKASVSHTAALATNSVLLKEAAQQMGYTMVSTIEQFIETTFFIDQMIENGISFPTNTMILTNAGGPGVNSVDLASNTGVPLASWSHATIQRFAAALPRVRPANPTDLLGDASTEDVLNGLEFALEDPGIDSVLLIITPQAVTDVAGITNALIQHERKSVLFAGEKLKPVIVALMGGEVQHKHIVHLREAGITALEYANEGVEIFQYVHQTRLSQRLDRPKAIRQSSLGFPTLRQPTRQSFPLQAANVSDTLLLLEAYGFTLPRCAIVSSKSQLDELDALDPQRTYPLIAKTTNLKLKHKAVLGAIVKDIQSKDEALRAFEHLQKFGKEIILQETIEDAQEIILGTRRDAQFGPFIAVGSGGSLTNIIADRSYVFLPATQKELLAAFKRTKIAPLLSVEQQSLVLLCLDRLARLMAEHPEIDELEINPLMVTKHIAYVADMKIELGEIQKQT